MSPTPKTVPDWESFSKIYTRLATFCFFEIVILKKRRKSAAFPQYQLFTNNDVQSSKFSKKFNHPPIFW